MKDTKELFCKAHEIYYNTMDEILEATGDDAEAEFILAEVVKSLAQELSIWVRDDLEMENNKN